MSAIDIIYLISAVLLASYGVNSIITVGLYLVHRRETKACPPLQDAPLVTVQLPIYNEFYVLERLLTAVVSLDYPRDRLQIQVLDDSTDETAALAEDLVKRYRSQGMQIDLLHRTNRAGFKAGALKEGLPKATGEYIAIFDADFVPEPNFLRRTIPHFLVNSRLGMIQTRWGHINAGYSTLTRAQAIALDGHFVVEQTARNRSGLFMNFNGTAGLWRKSCIEAAGGWQADTICEDLDLSYRAQLDGWDFLFLPDVVVPAEIPPQLNAFKRQQSRWAKGSIQCAMKLAGTLARAKVPIRKRLYGMLHLTSYCVHPLMILLLLTTLPFILHRSTLSRYVGVLSVASLGPPLMYLVAQRTLHSNWLKKFTIFPLLVLMGTGIAWSNTRAVWEAVRKSQNQFHRTPKFRVEGQKDKWSDSPYALPLDGDTLAELAFAAYAGFTTYIAIQQGNFFVVPFLLIYVAGFSYVALLGILHSARKQSRSAAPGIYVFKPKATVTSMTYRTSLATGHTLYLGQAIPSADESKPLSKTG